MEATKRAREGSVETINSDTQVTTVQSAVVKASDHKPVIDAPPPIPGGDSLPLAVRNLISHLTDPGWHTALADEFSKPYFASLASFIEKERHSAKVLPLPHQTFAALNATPFGHVRVVLLGQDPYPTAGHAHGLAFSVPHGVKIPGSLRNMYALMEKQLSIPPASHGNLTAWALRGILLLNVCLTVRAGESDSHAKKGWEQFTDAVVEAVARRHPTPVVFFLLGSKAKVKAELVLGGKAKGKGVVRPDPACSRHEVVSAPHPSPLSVRLFAASNAFSDLAAAAGRLGMTVDLSLPPPGEEANVKVAAPPSVIRGPPATTADGSSPGSLPAKRPAPQGRLEAMFAAAAAKQKKQEAE